jgi:hypothetical protein
MMSRKTSWMLIEPRLASSRPRVILARDHGDDHHHQQQQDRQQRHRGGVAWAGDAAGEQGVQSLGGGLGPAAPDEGEEDGDQRERHPQRGPWRDPAEAHDGDFAGGHHVAGELDVVEGLEQGRDGDDPADADEPQGADVQRAEQPLAAADRDPERDQARAEDELDYLLAAEVGDVEDLLGGGEVGHLERFAGAELVGRPDHGDTSCAKAQKVSPLGRLLTLDNEAH